MTSYRYLGSATTNANGVATYNFTGTGAGKIDVIASLDNPITDSSLVSVPCSVLDTFFMDYKSDGTKNTNWTKSSSPTITTNNGETTISSTSNGYYFSNQKITGDFEAIIDCKNITGNGVRIGFANTNSTSFTKSTRIIFNNTSYYQLKIRRVNNQWEFLRKANGSSTWYQYNTLDTKTLTSEDCYFFIGLIFPSGDSNERTLSYQNLKIYSVDDGNIIRYTALHQFELQSGAEVTLENGVFTKSNDANSNLLNPSNPIRMGWTGTKTVEFEVVTVSTLAFQIYQDEEHRYSYRLYGLGASNGSNVKFVYDGTKITVYIDGVEKTQYQQTMTFDSNYMITITNQGAFRNVVVY